MLRLSAIRRLSTHRALVLESLGEPGDNVVLKTSEAKPVKLEKNQILVEHLAACINPADINVIQGVYGFKPSLPAIIGNEGVTRVLELGSDIKHLKAGDLAISPTAFGYWQSHSVRNGDTFYKVDNNLDITTAAQLKVNPCTAYRMIKDYYPLKPGDTIIQNAANSAVGIYAIQLAKHWGYKTINVIRDRANKQEIVDELKNYGADFVVTEEEVRNKDVMKPIISETGEPSLLLDCVGGKNGVGCLRWVREDGYSIIYGLMSKQAHMQGGLSIFKQHTIKYFWISKWYTKRDPSARHEVAEMFDAVGGMFRDGILRPKPSKLVTFEEREVAFSDKHRDVKYIFSINK